MMFLCDINHRLNNDRKKSTRSTKDYETKETTTKKIAKSMQAKT